MLECEANAARHCRITTLLKAPCSRGTVETSGWSDLEREFGDQVYSEALYQLTRLELDPERAKTCLGAIAGHRRELTRSLGRPVDMLTATCDYFHHVQPMLDEPVLVEVRLLLQKEEGAFRDELTGMFNRRYFNLELEREIEIYHRFGHPFSLLMIDADHFKRFNDQFGHLAGDEALRRLAGTIVQTARICDRPARYGGEEFVVILPQACRAEAMVAAERIRAAAESSPILYGGLDLGAVTVSIGVASLPADADNAESLIAKADQALYQAKRQRNHVAAFQGSRRIHPRFALDDRVHLAPADGPGEPLACTAHNISFGGLLCETDALGPFDAPLEVTLRDHEKDAELSLRVRVRRVNRINGGRYYLGLSFELPTPEQQNQLMDFIHSRSRATH